MREECGALPIFLSDVKARHDKMVGLVETMMTADSLRLIAYGPDEDEIRVVEDLRKAKPPLAPAAAAGGSTLGSPQFRPQSGPQTAAQGEPALSSAQARPYGTAPAWLSSLHFRSSPVPCPLLRPLWSPGACSPEGLGSQNGDRHRRHPWDRPQGISPDDTGGSS